MTVETHGNHVVRVGPAENAYLCAEGQSAANIARPPARIATPLIRTGGELVPGTWDDAVSAVAAGLNLVKTTRGPKSIGFLGSARTTNEDNYVFQKFARTVVGTNNIDMLARHRVVPDLNTVFLAGEFRMIRKHDAILVLDKNVDAINPLIGGEIVHAVRQEGRRLVVVSNEPNRFTRIASAVIGPHNAVAGLARALKNRESDQRTDVSQAAALLKASRSVAVVVPPALSPDEEVLMRELRLRLNNVSYYPLVRGANLQGGLDMGVTHDYYPGREKVGPRSRAKFGKAWNAILPEAPGMNAVEMLQAVESGNIASLYIMGDDPAKGDPDTAALLGKLDFLVVQDVRLTDTARLANVVLPAAGLFEKTGTMTNLERRLRLLTKVEECAGSSMPDWMIIKTLANRTGSWMHYQSAVEIMMEIKAAVPSYRDLAIDACWSPEGHSAADRFFSHQPAAQPRWGRFSPAKGRFFPFAVPPVPKN